MRHLALIAIVIGASACGGAARPGPQMSAVEHEAEARRLAATAQVHFDLGEYRAAAADLRAAYRHHTSPGLLYNLGQAHRLAGDCADATTVYGAYLRAAPDSPHREVVEGHLAALGDCPPATTASAGRELRPGRTRQRVGLGVGAAGVVLFVAGALVSADGMSGDDGSARRGPDDEPPDPVPVERGVPPLGAALLCAGGAALGVGITFYVLGARDERRAARVTLVPGRDATTLQASWRF